MEPAEEETDFEAGRRERNDFTGCNTPYISLVSLLLPFLIAVLAFGLLLNSHPATLVYICTGLKSSCSAQLTWDSKTCVCVSRHSLVAAPVLFTKTLLRASVRKSFVSVRVDGASLLVCSKENALEVLRDTGDDLEIVFEECIFGAVWALKALPLDAFASRPTESLPPFMQREGCTQVRPCPSHVSPAFPLFDRTFSSGLYDRFQ